MKLAQIIVDKIQSIKYAIDAHANFDETKAALIEDLEWLENMEKRFFFDICMFKTKSKLHPTRLEVTLDVVTRIASPNPLSMRIKENSIGKYISTHGYMRQVSVANNNHLIDCAHLLNILTDLEGIIPMDKSISNRVEEYMNAVAVSKELMVKIDQSIHEIREVAAKQASILKIKAIKRMHSLDDATEKKACRIRIDKLSSEVGEEVVLFNCII